MTHAHAYNIYTYAYIHRWLIRIIDISHHRDTHTHIYIIHVCCTQWCLHMNFTMTTPQGWIARPCAQAGGLWQTSSQLPLSCGGSPKPGADLIDFWHVCCRQVSQQVDFPWGFSDVASARPTDQGRSMDQGWVWVPGVRDFKGHHVLLIVSQHIQFVHHVWLNAFH